MVILKATSFLEGHKRDMGMTCSITRSLNIKIYKCLCKIKIYIYIYFFFVCGVKAPKIEI